MASPFKGKVGQLVSWDLPDQDKEITSHIGIVTEVNENGSVIVEFLKNNWVITIQTINLKLLNDVETDQ
jgi:hypothetical protein